MPLLKELPALCPYVPPDISSKKRSSISKRPWTTPSGHSRLWSAERKYRQSLGCSKTSSSAAQWQIPFSRHREKKSVNHSLKTIISKQPPDSSRRQTKEESKFSCRLTLLSPSALRAAEMCGRSRSTRCLRIRKSWTLDHRLSRSSSRSFKTARQSSGTAQWEFLRPRRLTKA